MKDEGLVRVEKIQEVDFGEIWNRVQLTAKAIAAVQQPQENLGGKSIEATIQEKKGSIDGDTFHKIAAMIRLAWECHGKMIDRPVPCMVAAAAAGSPPVRPSAARLSDTGPRLPSESTATARHGSARQDGMFGGQCRGSQMLSAVLSAVSSNRSDRVVRCASPDVELTLKCLSA